MTDVSEGQVSKTTALLAKPGGKDGGINVEPVNPSDKGGNNVETETPEKPPARGWKTRYAEDLGIDLVDLDLWEEIDEAQLISTEEVYELAESRGFDRPEEESEKEVFREERRVQLAKMHLYGLLRIAKAIESLKQQP